MREYDLVIIGSGAAGIICAIEASKKGINNILIIEKDPIIGGMLSSGNYNIGGKVYITGKKYKEDLIKELENYDINIDLNTMALKIIDNNEIVCTSNERGIEKVRGKNIIIANGGKEISRNHVTSVGDRVSGIITVGMAKKIFAMDNTVPGKNILIVGDSTIYMIEDELKKYNINIVGIVCEENNSNKVEFLGLSNNIYKGYDLLCISGDGRINKATISNGKETLDIDCDTLIFAYPMLSDGVVAMRSNLDLNPKTTGAKVDNNYKTSKSNIYACGNAIYIHNDIFEIEEECKKLINNIR